MISKKTKPVISYLIVIFMILSLVLTRINLKNLVSFALPESQDFVIGDHVVATWCEGRITIHGSGATYDYSKEEPVPFGNLKNQTKEIVIEEGITGIGSYLFFDFGNLEGTLQLPSTLLSIGDYAFSGLSKETAPQFSLVVNQFVSQKVLVEGEEGEIENEERNGGFRKETGSLAVLRNLSEIGGNDEEFSEGQNGRMNGNPMDGPKEDAGEDDANGGQGSGLNGDARQDNGGQTPAPNEDAGQNDANGGQDSGSNEDAGQDNGGQTPAPNEDAGQNDANGGQGSGSNEDAGQDNGSQNPAPNGDAGQDNGDQTPAPNEDAEQDDARDDENTEDDEEQTEETEDDIDNEDTESGNNRSPVYRTIHEQVIGTEIFYPGQVGGYCVSEDNNRSFVRAMEALGYGGYLGSHQISIYGEDGEVWEVSVMNTTKGVVMPTLQESGMFLPVDTETVHYTFSCWESETGSYYLPHTYSQEYVFRMYLIKEFQEMEQGTLQVSLDEDTTLSVTGTFPKNTVLEAKDLSVLQEENFCYLFTPYLSVGDTCYEISEEMMFTITSSYFDELHEAKLFVKEQSEETLLKETNEENPDKIAFSIEGEKNLLLSIQEKEVAPEQVTYHIVATGVLLEMQEKEEFVLDETQENGLEAGNLTVSYGCDAEFVFAFEDDYNWPVSVHVYRQSNLLYTETFDKEDALLLLEKQEASDLLEAYNLKDEKCSMLLAKENELYYLMSGFYATSDLEIHVVAAKKNEKVVRLAIGTKNAPDTKWLETTEGCFTTLSNVNDLEGFAICYESEEGLPESELFLKTQNGYLPSGTELMVMYEAAGTVFMNHKTLENSCTQISLDAFLTGVSKSEITRFQIVVDYVNADLYGADANLYVQIVDPTHELIADNGVSVQVGAVACQSLSLYLDSGSGVAKKEVLLYEQSCLRIHVIKENSFANIYPYAVVAFYTDKECRIPAILPENRRLLGSGNSTGNLVYFSNVSGENLMTGIAGLSGTEGLTPGETYYIKAFVVKDCPEPYLIEKKNMICSDVVAVTIAPQAEFEMIVNGLEDSSVITAGLGLPQTQILYEIRNMAAGENYQVKAELSKVSTGEDQLSYEVLKQNIVSKDYQFTTREGTTSGSFENVKLFIPADLEGGMYRIRFILCLKDQDNIYAEALSYFVVEE